MHYVYYDEAKAQVTLTREETEALGKRIGVLDFVPVRPAFAVQALMTNAGYAGITGLTIVVDPPNQES